MHKKSLTTLAAFLLVAASASALDLSVDQAVDYALQHSRTLQSSRIDLEILEKDDKTSWNSLLPTMQVSTMMSRRNEVADTAATKMSGKYTTTDPNWSLVTNLSFSWNFTPALLTQMKLTRQKYENGQLTWDQAVADTKVNVKKLYYAILLQQESLKISEATLANQKERMEQTEQQYNDGYASELAYLQTQVTYENQLATVKKARQAVNEQKRNLAFVLGMDETTDLTLTTPIETEFVDVDAARAYSRIGYRFDVRNLEQQATMLDTQLKMLDQSSFYPVFVASASGTPTIADISEKWFDRDSGNWTDQGSISFGLSFNITNALPWSSNRQSARQLKQNIEKMQVTRNTLNANAHLEITNLLDELDQAREAIESAERNITLAQKSYDMTSEAYQTGFSELLDVNDAQQALNQAKLGKMSDQYTYLCALLDLEYATQDNL